MGADWIRTDRLVLRPLERSDVDRLVLMSQDSGFGPEPRDHARALAWVEESIESMNRSRLGSWAVLEHGHGIGVATLMPRQPDGEGQPLLAVEYRLLHSSWGKGLATEAILGLIDYGHAELGHREFHAFISPENTRAKNVAFKVGMTYWRMARLDQAVQEVFRSRVTPGHPGTRSSDWHEKVA
jgi:RimJ/RimL family protein N-acetyltransferase